MNLNDRRLLHAALRGDFASFIHRTFKTVVPGQDYLDSWHIEAIAYHLEQCRRRQIQRLIITMPPRSLKSICASVALPAFLLGHDPTTRIICASYAQDLATKHARDCRAVMESGWYQDLFRTRLDRRKNTEAEFETTDKGSRLATSVGGTLTGRGGSFIIIDDPMKPADAESEVKREAVKQWYDATLLSRLDNKQADVIVLVMQRLHMDDLVGHVLPKGGWTHLDLPAIADMPQEIQIGEGRLHRRAAGDALHPAREPLEVLDSLKAEMGSQAFSAQYLQTPVPAGGALFKQAWFGSYASPLTRSSGDRIIQSWDTASKVAEGNDWSACTTWLVRGPNYYLLDVLRQRFEYPELKRCVISHAKRYSASPVLIEDAGSGTFLIQELRREGPLKPIGIKPDGDKAVRAAAQTPKVEAGHVHLPENANWLGEFMAEALAFPSGRFDDQVDSMVQFLAWIARNTLICPAPGSVIRKSPNNPYN